MIVLVLWNKMDELWKYSTEFCSIHTHNDEVKIQKNCRANLNGFAKRDLQ